MSTSLVPKTYLPIVLSPTTSAFSHASGEIVVVGLGPPAVGRSFILGAPQLVPGSEEKPLLAMSSITRSFILGAPLLVPGSEKKPFLAIVNLSSITQTPTTYWRHRGIPPLPQVTGSSTSALNIRFWLFTYLRYNCIFVLCSLGQYVY